VSSKALNERVNVKARIQSGQNELKTNELEQQNYVI